MKVRKGRGEEIPLVQDKEQQLRFAGAAVKKVEHQIIDAFELWCWRRL